MASSRWLRPVVPASVKRPPRDGCGPGIGGAAPTASTSPRIGLSPTPLGSGSSVWSYGTEATTSGLAAAWWHGLTRFAPKIVEVTVPRTSHGRSHPGSRLRRRNLAPSDVVEHRGLRVTALALTVVEAAARRGGGARLMDSALQRHVDLSALWRAHLRNKGRYGSPAARRLLQAASDGARSEAERLLIKLLREAGITGWRTNYPSADMRSTSRFRGRRWPSRPTAGRFTATKRLSRMTASARTTSRCLAGRCCGSPGWTSPNTHSESSPRSASRFRRADRRSAHVSAPKSQGLTTRTDPKRPRSSSNSTAARVGPGWRPGSSAHPGRSPSAGWAFGRRRRCRDHRTPRHRGSRIVHHVEHLAGDRQVLQHRPAERPVPAGHRRVRHRITQHLKGFRVGRDRPEPLAVGGVLGRRMPEHRRLAPMDRKK